MARRVLDSAGMRTDPAKARRNDNESPTPREVATAIGEPDIVRLPKRRCVAIDGSGSPGDAAFEQAVGALYGTAYALKFARKKAGQHEFKIGPLEGRWAADVPPNFRGKPPVSTWRWRLRIGVPPDVTRDELERIKEQVVTKKRGKLAGSATVPHVFVEAVPAERVGRSRYAAVSASAACFTSGLTPTSPRASRESQAPSSGPV